MRGCAHLTVLSGDLPADPTQLVPRSTSEAAFNAGYVHLALEREQQSHPALDLSDVDACPVVIGHRLEIDGERKRDVIFLGRLEDQLLILRRVDDGHTEEQKLSVEDLHRHRVTVLDPTNGQSGNEPVDQEADQRLHLDAIFFFLLGLRQLRLEFPKRPKAFPAVPNIRPVHHKLLFSVGFR